MGIVVPACLKKTLHPLSPELRKLQRLSLKFYKCASEYNDSYGPNEHSFGEAPEAFKQYVADKVDNAHFACCLTSEASKDRFDGMGEDAYNRFQAEVEASLKGPRP